MSQTWVWSIFEEFTYSKNYWKLYPDVAKLKLNRLKLGYKMQIGLDEQR